MEAIKYYQIKQELQKKILHPVYFFYGPEDYLQEEITNEIIKRAVPDSQREFCVERYSAVDIELDMLASVFAGVSFFSSKKVVVISNVEKIKAAAGSSMARFLEEPGEGMHFIFTTTEPKIPAKNELVAALKKTARCVIFYKLFPENVLSWVNDYARRSGFSIEDAAAKCVIEYCDGMLRLIKTELDKIMLYSAAGKRITLEDTEVMQGSQKGAGVYSLGAFLLEKNAASGLECISNINMHTGNEIMVLNYISKLMRKFAAVKLSMDNGCSAEQVRAKFGLNKSPEKEMPQAAKKFSISDIACRISLLADAEYKIKTGQGSPKMVLTDLWVKICK